MQLEDWLDDLCVRFIINIPQEELVELERICFQIEEAQWFYEDFIRPLDPKLPSLGLKPFFQRIIQRCPVFKDRPHEDWASAYDRFILYKNRVPVRGAILLNDQMDQILLVKGWKKHATWSFPRGKINKDEADIDCAIREAWEETGFDIKSAGLIKDPRKVRHIEKTLRDQSVKLFIFRGVPTDYNFVPQTRKEISKCEWYKIADLPTSAKAKLVHQEGTGQHLVLNANKFYMVAPFVQELKKVIGQFKKSEHRHSSKLAAPPSNIATTEPQYPDDFHQPITTDPSFLLSPAIPSTLPEVTPTSAQDQSLRLKQQLDMPPNNHLDNSNPAMSNALLNLLRGTPATEMRLDPPTPLEQATFTAGPQSPNQLVRTFEPPVQSPPLAFEHQPDVLPPSAQPQLNQHVRSLLDTFNQPKVQSPALEARQHLPAAKQDLLAAFMSKSRTASATQPPPVSVANHGNDLLQKLQRKQALPEAEIPQVIAREPDAPFGTDSTSTQAANNLNSPSLPTQGPSNSLLGLLKGGGTGAFGGSQSVSSTSVAAEAPKAQRAEVFKQAEPAELSATSDHEKPAAPVDTVKANILSMLGATPQKSPRNFDKDKTRKASTAATLSGPIVQPQFDAVKAPVSEDDMKRPVTNQRKLFDPKTDELKATPTKVMSRHDDRSKQQKSQQRTVKQQKSSNTGRVLPKELKEPPKPFQPQILKRPNATGGEVSPLSVLPRSTMPAEGLIATMTTQSPDQAFVSATAPRAQISLSEDAPQIAATPVASPSAAVFPTPIPMPVVPQDPQREALLSLLRTPSQPQSQSQRQPPTPIDPDRTPRPVTTQFAASDIKTIVPPPTTTAATGVSPPLPVPSQIVSPIHDFDPFASRSRVSSLASISNGLATSAGGKEATTSVGMSATTVNRPQVEKRQTAAGDKAFLMSYLRGFATQGQES